MSDRISAHDIAARMPRMRELFSAANVGVPVIACCNVDTGKLPKDSPIPLPKPSILHSIVDCDVCAEKCWIGPHQAATKGTRTCYICLGILYKFNAFPLTVKSLDPDADNVPRRVT